MRAHRDRHQVAELVVALALVRLGRGRQHRTLRLRGRIGDGELGQHQGPHARGHASRAQERMEMPVLATHALRRGVRVIVELGVGRGVVDVALGIVVPLVEDAGATQRLADDRIAGLVQHSHAILKLAAEHFECAEEDLEIANGEVSVVGVPGQAIKLGALALKANPMRGAVRPGTEPGLESTQYFGPPSGTTANGAHAMIVEVDPQTFALNVLKYVVVHDCGTVINPLILAGQVHGGVAQGIGNAFYEQLVFDDDGQLLNASLADYLLPTALEVPNMEIGHTVTASPLNPLGIKGAGEAGAIPVGALFAQAIEDALGLTPSGVEILEIPLDPARLWQLVTKPR